MPSQDLLRDIVPAGAMGLTITQLSDERVELHAPLAPNVNDKGTAFGGSISSALLLAGWSLIAERLRGLGISAEVYIHKMDLEFLKPITSAFSSHAKLSDEGLWARFVQTLAERGRARIEITAESFADGVCAARTHARYVAILKEAMP